MKILKTLLKEWYILVIIFLPYILSPFIWNQVPDQIPVHWNIQGEVDSFADKFDVMVFMPLAAIGTYFLILLAPYIDPKKRLKIDQKPLPALRLFLPALFTAIFIVMVIPAFKSGVDQTFLVYLVVTLTLLVIGNYLRTLKPNYFIGIRTPWTLEDPENWKATHRLGSKLWISTTLIVLIVSFFVPVQVFSYVFFAGVMIMAVIPLAYSFYYYYRQDEGLEEK